MISVITPLFAFTAAANGTIAYGAATVNTDILRLRSDPSMTSTVLTRLSEGDVVVILERTCNEWYKVNFHGLTGYVSIEYLRDILVAENFNAQGRLNGDHVNLRTKPERGSSSLGRFSNGTTMTIIGINNGWYKVKHLGQTGYVRSDFMDVISGQKAASTSHASNGTMTDLQVGQQIVDFALQFIGTKYVWGGSSPSGFDCSGFVTYVYKNFDVSVTRTASGQYRDNGVHIDKSELMPGDLVFFSSNRRSVTHVGIFINEEEFVHASQSGVGVVISRLDSAYYTRVWWGAKRLVQ